MADTTEQKALALVNEVRVSEHRCKVTLGGVQNEFAFIALCRAIEQHETDITDLQAEYSEVCNLFEAFRQEVSDAIVFALKVYGGHRTALDPLRRFIIAKPDPLAEAVAECDGTLFGKQSDYVKALRAAIEKRGGKIVWGEG